MNLLLCKYDNFDNYELSNIINCYQDYFTFKIIDNCIYLYLDIKVLKYYLTEGFNIKYRKHIFLFLKNTILSINNTSYKFSKYIKSKYEDIKIDCGLYKNDDILEKYDIENLELITNISNKIRLLKNKFYIKDKNILKLDNNFYANLNTGTFLFTNVNSYLFRYNGIILNYNCLKNRLLTLLSIMNVNKNYNKYNIDLSEDKYENSYITKETEYTKSTKYTKNNFINNNFLKTKCTLIILNKKNIEKWCFYIKKYLNCKKYYSISSKSNLKYIKNRDILDLDFLFIDVNFLKSKYFKSYFQNYEIFLNKDTDSYYVPKVNNMNILVYNSINDCLSNKNIENEKIYNLYIFNWNNIIYDNIDEIIDLDKNNSMKYFFTYNTKYYLSENYIEDATYNYIIDTSIINIDNILELNYNYSIDISNFYYFVKNELLIKDIDKKLCDIIYVGFELNTFEKDLYNYLFNNNCDNIIDDINNLSNIDYKKIKCIQLFLINSMKHNFKKKTLDEIEKINNEHYTKLINNEIVHSKFKKKYSNIDNNDDINNYTSKILFFKNTIKTFNENECYCIVCMDKIVDSKIACIVTCGHYFCNKCILKYITEKYIENNLMYYECPVCRTYFTLNMIYSINSSCNSSCNSSKIEKLFNIIKNNDFSNKSNINNVKKIIIVTQYRESLYSIKDYIEKNNLENDDEQICLINLFYNNVLTKKKYIETFNNNNENNVQNMCKYSLILCNYDDIVKYNFKRINQIIFIDQPTNNILSDIKEKYSNKYLDKFSFYNSSFKMYFLYAENTIEEKIIEKYKIDA